MLSFRPYKSDASLLGSAGGDGSFSAAIRMRAAFLSVSGSADSAEISDGSAAGASPSVFHADSCADKALSAAGTLRGKSAAPAMSSARLHSGNSAFSRSTSADAASSSPFCVREKLTVTLSCARENAP